jgi:predicted RNase H-like HicB family nuclease
MQFRRVLHASPSTKVLDTGGKLYDTTHNTGIFSPQTGHRNRGKTMDIPILIQTDSARDSRRKYGVTVPDIPGCTSSGDTVDNAMRNVTQAIYGHVGTMLRLGRAFEIKPSPFEELSKEPDYAGGIWALVSVDLAKLDV